MDRFITTLLATAALVGCNSRTPEDNIDPSKVSTVVVGKHEGCTLYRTETLSGPNVTWVRCKEEPKVSEVNYTESCGKNCTRNVKTVTIEEAK